MAAPGKLRLKDCGFDCKELRMASCKITKNGVGGPLITYKGCIIGMNFYAKACTPFIPIKIALKCLEQLQKYRRVPRPWLGVKLTDVETSELGELEKLNQSFPNTFRGVIVREVESGGPASVAGVCAGDVIAHLGGKPVGNSMEFGCMVLEKAEEPMEAIVKRASTSSSLALTLQAHSASSLNRWPIPKEWVFTKIA